jgi:hypothetical protein
MLPLALEDDGHGFVWIDQVSTSKNYSTRLERRAARIAEGELPGYPDRLPPARSRDAGLPTRKSSSSSAGGTSRSRATSSRTSS